MRITVRARQVRVFELSTHQERNPSTVSQLLTQIQELQNKVNSLSDARESFYDPEAVLERPTFPVDPLLFPSPRTMPRCDSGLPHDTRNTMGTSGNVSNDYLLEEDNPLLSSKIQRFWQPLVTN